MLRLRISGETLRLTGDASPIVPVDTTILLVNEAGEILIADTGDSVVAEDPHGD